MKTVEVREADNALSALLEEVQAGEEIILARDGKPLARLIAVAPAQAAVRQPGILKTLPGWKDFVYDPAVFAPMTDEEMAAEGWPI